MKKSIYVLGILTLLLFNCSVDETSSDLNEQGIAEILLENEAKTLQRYDSGRSSDSPLECFSTELIGEKGEVYGNIEINIHADDVEIIINCDNDFTLERTALEVVDYFDLGVESLEDIVLDSSTFNYSGSHEAGTTKMSYVISKGEIGPTHVVAVYAALNHKKLGIVEAWGDDLKTYFKPYLYLCELWNMSDYQTTEIEACASNDDLDFYIPLKVETSGNYPEFGTNADSVTLNQDNPHSEGTLEIELEFNDLPDSFSAATLSLDFEDLDLHTDTYSKNGNTITFSESFTLTDTDGNIIETLDGSHAEDGSFRHVINIPDSAVVGNSLILYITLNAQLELIEGNQISVSNTSEKISGIRLCGTGLE